MLPFLDHPLGAREQKGTISNSDLSENHLISWFHERGTEAASGEVSHSQQGAGLGLELGNPGSEAWLLPQTLPL